MEKHQQGKFSSLTFLNPQAKTRAASSPRVPTPHPVSDLSFASELHTHSALALVPHLRSASTRVRQHFIITTEETLASALVPPEAAPALQPLPVTSLVSPGPPHRALALAPLPVGYRVLRSDHVPQVHFIWFSCNTENCSSICMLLPFVSSNTCQERKVRTVSPCAAQAPHAAAAPVAWITALQNSTKKLICGLQRKYPSSHQAPYPQAALKTKLLKILRTP